MAAIFVEPIQGEGGYIVPPAEWLVRLRELCDRHGILLVADEVQSGMGRTGQDVGDRARRRRARRADQRPRGIASGLPLGAFVARAELMETWGAGAHGSTYGGSPVPCAAGLATLEIIRAEGLLAQRHRRSATSCSSRLARAARRASPGWSPTCAGSG